MQKWCWEVLLNLGLRVRVFLGFVILLMAVLVMWLIPIFIVASIDGEIDSLESKDNLTQMEQKRLNDLQWSKNWWITTKVTLFNPLAMLILTITVVTIIVIIACWLLWRFVLTLARASRLA